jgi:RecT family
VNRAAKRRIHKRRPVVRRKPKPSVQIVRVPTPVEKPWELGQDQITILKNSICKGATDDEMKYCLIVAQRYKLDPFKQQIWFLPRWDKNADAGNGAKGRNVYVPQVSINGLLHTAARDHRDFGSLSEPEYGPLFEMEVEGHKFKAPEWCRVKAFKKGIDEPSVATIYFEEFCPQRWENAKLFWARMPRNQIAKCCKAQVVKAAYPDLGGVYIPEECERINEDFTESGREIVVAPGPGSKEAAQEAGRRFFEEKKAEMEARGQKPFRGVIELDWSKDEALPVVRGEIAEQLETMKLNLHMAWGQDNEWHCEPRDAEALRVICQQFGYELKQVLPDKFPAANAPAKVAPAAEVVAASKHAPEKAPSGARSRAGHASEGGSKEKQAEPVSRTPENSVQQATRDAKPAQAKEIPSRERSRPISTPRALIPFAVKAVKWTPSGKGLEVILDTGAKLYAFDNRKMGEDGEKLLDLLVKEAVGKTCVFATVKNKTKEGREYIQIKAALQIGDREWDEEGLPILRRDLPHVEREPGED